MWAAMQAFSSRRFRPSDLNPYHQKEIPEVDTVEALKVFLPNPNKR